MAKVDILLNATGDAPIMKNKKWKLDRAKTIESILEFIRNYLDLKDDQSMFIYINQAFAPALDSTIGNLYDTFSIDGKLVFYYCTNQAWG
ncbi:hypothetical protein A3Q56_05322 [Intoshia linei]|uniref:Ubiquitin-like protein ATG12 n=1 Tax=Intoshia linei TaxID=1819745 RepID=A0A177B000_9BILA|nr:hypothetical protein A3Q56_05322 [Intoshia linei]